MTTELSAYPQYRKWFLLGLLVQIIAAWFSVGYHHPDEQFQVLEFCNYKLGHSPASDLPWEFFSQCRSGLLPLVAYGMCRALEAIHCYNPFTAAVLLRLSAGVLCWWTTLRLVKLLLPDFVTDKGKLFFVYSCFLLWFVPYIGVRFSSDNVSGLLFFLGISFVLGVREQAAGKRVARLLLAGLLLGFAFSLRLQLAFALLGVAIWILFIQKWRIGDVLLLCLGGFTAIGLSMVADHWLYGSWVIVPVHYYDVNIVQQKAANYGVFPWYTYFEWFIELAVPPISLVLLPLFFGGIWKKPKSIFSLICITFLAGHLFIGHKEMRFLFPVLLAFIYLACIGMDAFILKYNWRTGYDRLFKLIAGVNVVLLVVKICTPAQEVVSYYAYLYDYAQHNAHTTLVSFKESPYSLVGLEVNFYKNPALHVTTLSDTAGLATVMHQAAGPVLYLSPNLVAGPELAGYKVERMYCLFPSWLLKFNINDWEGRSRIWTVFRILP